MASGQLYRVLKHAAWLLPALCPVDVRSQSVSTFTPGGQQLVLLDFSTFPLGSIPPTQPGQCRPGMPVCDIRGNLAIVVQNGVPMLRASARSSFIVTLPQRLPADFTLEFDLISKTCCQPEDLAFEGTREITQDATSANVLWHHNSHAIVGGVKDQGFSQSMPDKLRASVMGSLANIAVSFRGTSLTMYTNGEELYTTQREFVRGSVLRVFLGGQNDTDRAVYLARLRIATGAPVLASSQPLPTPTGVNAGSVTTAGTGPPPGTQPTQRLPASAGAGTSGPVARGNPAAAATAASLAPPAQRTIPLSGVTASGVRMVPRVVGLPAVSASGQPAVVASRTVKLNSLSAAGASVMIARRSIRMVGITARGAGRQSRGASSLAARTIAVPQFASSGPVNATTPRSIVLPAIAGSGQSSSMPPRIIRLTAVGASGAGIVPPRTIKLAAVAASGPTKTP